MKPPRFPNQGARALKDYRKAHGLSQEAFAALVGVTQSTVSEWESEIKRPWIEHATSCHRETKGVVGFHLWSELPPPPPKPAKKRARKPSRPRPEA